MKKKPYRESDKIWKKFLGYKRLYRKQLPKLREIDGDILKVLAHLEVRLDRRAKQKRLKRRWQEIFGRKERKEMNIDERNPSK